MASGVIKETMDWQGAAVSRPFKNREEWRPCINAAEKEWKKR